MCVCRVGDVLESVNGHSLNNAHHAQAVAVVKESKGLLDIVSTHTHTQICTTGHDLNYFGLFRLLDVVRMLMRFKWAWLGP